MQSYIGEWSSPDFHQPRYLPTLVMILATIALAALSPRRLRPREILLLSVATYAALRSVRHIPIYALIATPIGKRDGVGLVAGKSACEAIQGDGKLP